MFISDLPDNLETGTGHVKVVPAARFQGNLSCNVVSSKQRLKSAILDHKESSTGFLMWISNYCISCIFQKFARQKLSYAVFAYDDTKPTHVLQVFSDIESVIDPFCAIVQSKLNCVETKYELAFLRCSCELSNTERKQKTRKHKSAAENASIQERRREKYRSMGPEKRQKLISNNAEMYGSMDSQKKEQLLSKNKQNYHEGKSELLCKIRQKYHDIEPELKGRKLTVQRISIMTWMSNSKNSRKRQEKLRPTGHTA